MSVHRRKPRAILLKNVWIQSTHRVVDWTRLIVLRVVHGRIEIRGSVTKVSPCWWAIAESGIHPAYVDSEEREDANDG